MCDKKVHLGVSSNKFVKLSNWIRHVKGCVQENRGKQKSQLALTKYFSLHSDTSSSDVLNPASGSESSSPHSPPTDLTKSPIHPKSPPATQKVHLQLQIWMENITKTVLVMSRVFS